MATKPHYSVTSGPPRLIWDRTGLPVVQGAEPDVGVTYHLASRIEEYTLPSRPESMADYHADVASISNSLNCAGRVVGRHTGFRFDAEDTIPAWVQRRRSTRAFSGQTMAARDLCVMLGMGFQKRSTDECEQRNRIVPSAGGLYSLDAYVLAWNIEALSKGCYFVDADGGCLRLVYESHELADMCSQCQFTVSADNVQRASGMIVLVWVSERLLWKYGARSYRFACLEAGHVMHGVALGAALSEVGLCILGGYCDERLDALVRVDGVTEMVVYAGLFGPPTPT